MFKPYEVDTTIGIVVEELLDKADLLYVIAPILDREEIGSRWRVQTEDDPVMRQSLVRILINALKVQREDILAGNVEGKDPVFFDSLINAIDVIAY